MQIKINDLIGKTVMSREGFIIGKIRKIQDADKFKDIKTTLIKPARKANLHQFKLNKQGEIEIPMNSLTKVKNILILEDIDKNSKTIKPIP
jgi:sporulation protein YlmC with PRC-barrel domain